MTKPPDCSGGFDCFERLLDSLGDFRHHLVGVLRQKTATRQSVCFQKNHRNSPFLQTWESVKKRCPILCIFESLNHGPATRPVDTNIWIFPNPVPLPGHFHKTPPGYTVRPNRRAGLPVPSNRKPFSNSFQRRFLPDKNIPPAELERLQNLRTTQSQKDKKMALYIRTLKKQPVVLREWSDTIWTVMVEKAIVHRDGAITFVFKNGTEIKVGE